MMLVLSGKHSFFDYSELEEDDQTLFDIPHIFPKYAMLDVIKECYTYCWFCFELFATIAYPLTFNDVFRFE